MSEFRRRLLMNQTKSVAANPAIYNTVSVTGNSYVDTDIYPNVEFGSNAINTELEVHYGMLDYSSSSNFWWGVGWSADDRAWNSNDRLVLLPQSGKTWMYCSICFSNDTGPKYYGSNIANANYHAIKAVLNKDGYYIKSLVDDTVYMNNEKAPVTFTGTVDTKNVSNLSRLGIFNIYLPLRSMWSYTRTPNAWVSQVIIRNGGTVYHNLVAYAQSSTSYGFLDTITGKFYPVNDTSLLSYTDDYTKLTYNY